MSDWALILGASSGIGAACAKELAKSGVNIYGIYLRKKSNVIDDLTSELKSYGVDVIYKKMSATNSEKRSKAITELKNIENINIKIFIHSLAFGTLKPMIADDSNNMLNQKNIEMTMDVMANSLVYWTQDLFTNNLLSENSQIFSMTSAGSHIQWKSYGAVSMAKAALESATRQLAIELAPYKIAANAIQAGITDTEALRKIPGSDKMIKDANNGNPNKRLTLPEDVAKAVINIGLSNENWMTGNTIRLDGGEDILGS
tara:strand:+ start:5892 stop:6665 length:774 start_codon:yes stop_codon:yes gene_type:complete